MSTLEVWRPVARYEGIYEVSDIGRVRSLERIGTFGRRWPSVLRRTHINVTGYRALPLYRGDGGASHRIHRLVCEAFHGTPLPGQVVRHLDGDCLNNCAENLTWGTFSENSRDAVRHRTNNNSAKDSCKNGHLLEGANLHIAPTGYRVCRTCNRNAVARYVARKADHR
ncbi:MAG: hypothetical protein JWQ81_1653 [Amycolatopsis sp.]|jgi:hypothetical protein|uniref:HNH endonuclease n=1 Tax=Amycolatopsis sp. TaxID=37632 RepID=UPI0026274766|nr:HNH endonuclease [Amycolatopsis sp.]MCU1680914.1 hypothetical protein [Amycolatopsis sp.]